jgi:hypothetical protein
VFSIDLHVLAVVGGLAVRACQLGAHVVAPPGSGASTRAEAGLLQVQVELCRRDRTHVDLACMVL